MCSLCGSKAHEDVPAWRKCQMGAFKAFHTEDRYLRAHSPSHNQVQRQGHRPSQQQPAAFGMPSSSVSSITLHQLHAPAALIAAYVRLLHPPSPFCRGRHPGAGHPCSQLRLQSATACRPRVLTRDRRDTCERAEENPKGMRGLPHSCLIELLTEFEHRVS